MDLSDEEKHALELRRERSNKISKLMGECLLKGYKMLGSTCNKCGTILMRDRQQNDYCVSCIDIDGAPGVPDMDAMMIRMTDESRISPDRSPINRLEEGQEDIPLMARPYQVTNYTDEYRGIVKDIENSVLAKMRWAGMQLQSSGLDESLKLLDLIKSCQETLSRLKNSR